MKKTILTSLLLCLVLPIFLANAAVPNDSGVSNGFNDNRSVGNSLLPPAPARVETKISTREASDLARENFEGRVLSIRLVGNRWRIRMDDEGTVFNVFVDANTGETSRAED